MESDYIFDEKMGGFLSNVIGEMEDWEEYLDILFKKLELMENKINQQKIINILFDIAMNKNNEIKIKKILDVVHMKGDKSLLKKYYIDYIKAFPRQNILYMKTLCTQEEIEEIFTTVYDQVLCKEEIMQKEFSLSSYDGLNKEELYQVKLNQVMKKEKTINDLKCKLNSLLYNYCKEQFVDNRQHVDFITLNDFLNLERISLFLENYKDEYFLELYLEYLFLTRNDGSSSIIKFIFSYIVKNKVQSEKIKTILNKKENFIFLINIILLI